MQNHLLKRSTSLLLALVLFASTGFMFLSSPVQATVTIASAANSSIHTTDEVKVTLQPTPVDPNAIELQNVTDAKNNFVPNITNTTNIGIPVLMLPTTAGITYEVTASSDTSYIDDDGILKALPSGQPVDVTLTETIASAVDSSIYTTAEVKVTLQPTPVDPNAIELQNVTDAKNNFVPNITNTTNIGIPVLMLPTTAGITYEVTASSDTSYIDDDGILKALSSSGTANIGLTITIASASNPSIKTTEVVIVTLTAPLGSIPGNFRAGIGGISAFAAAANIFSQDGIGYSGSIPGNEVIGTTFTGYQAWPSGFTRGSTAFVGGVYDGTSIWMIPYNADRLIKVNPSTGEMTGYSDWPAGFTKGSSAFAGGVYDGTNIWLIPYSANQVVKVNAATGEMTGYSSWPGGSRGSEQFIGGAFDGTHIWLTPYSGSRLVKLDTATGAMTSYTNWPSGTSLGSNPFYGSIFDGTSIWLIPNGADRLIKVDPGTGEMTGYSNWPSGFTKSADAFWGGVFDGSNLWLIPYNATHVVKIDTATGVMTGYNGWPSGFTKGSGGFAGGVYDGTNIWMVPMSANMLIKINAATGVMTGFNNWPSSFTKDSSAFLGGVYDGENVWMIPFLADRLMKFGYSSDLSGLTLSSGTLSPAFSSATTSYTANVGNEVTSIDVTPTTADADSTVSVNGSAVTSGQSQVIALNVGDNTVTIMVTSSNGDMKTYTVTVTRAASSNADLSGLTLSAGALSPTFSAATTSYTASVGNEVTSIDVTPTTADADSTVTVNGSAVASGQAKATALNVGANTITVQVTAKDGITKKSYMIQITVTSSNGSGGTNGTDGTDGTGGTGGNGSSSGSNTKKSDPGNPTRPPQPAQPTPTQPVFNDKVDLAAVRSIVERGNNAPAVSFTDVSPSSWSASVIERSARMGIVSGFGNGNFKPDANVTRAEFASMMVRAFGLTSGSGANFADTQGQWAADAIATLKALGILTGYDDGTFRPNQEISRSEIVVILARLTNYVPSATSPFSDVGSNWAAEEIGAFATAGIVSGKGEGKFEPAAPASRAESVAIIVRTLDKLLAQG